MDTITITLIVVACTILSLGFAVIHTSRERLNQLYFRNILTIIGWVITMIFYRLSSDGSIVLWSKLLYVAASLIASDFLYFTYVFPKYTSVSIRKKLFIVIPNVVLIFLILFGDAMITGARVNPFGENLIHWGTLYPIYVVYILFYFNFAFFRLFKKFKAVANRIEKTQISFVLIGYVSSGMIAFTTNLILPSFGIFTLNWAGQISTLLMAISATYAIVKHGLFNAKIIATELIIFTLWMILLIRTLVSETASDMAISIITLALVFFVGLYLIRSVIKEVSQRERIEKLARELEAANVGQREFLHFLSHEVKGQFTVVSALFDSILSDPDYGPVSDKLRALVEAGMQRNKKAVVDIEDILVSADLKNGAVKYDMQAVDFKEAITELVKEIKPEADEKGITLQVSVDENQDYTVSADKRHLIGHAIRNLVENAVIYTQKGEVMITLSRRGNKVSLAIADSGVGLSDDDKARLFTEGGRGAESSKVNAHSTGHGLYIAKQIVEAHGGKVWAESEGRGKGSIFFVEVPCGRNE